jgi:ATP-binding cassette, subfamily B, bacterial
VAAIAMWQLADTLHSISWSMGTLRESALFLDDYHRFVSAPRVAPSPSDGERRRGPVRSISIEDVSFTYAGAARPALRGVSLVLRRGTVVALVGENGAGKTTLVKLLCGLYAPQGGRIRWDGGTGLAPEPRPGDQVAVIFQDFTRYSLTVRENIAVARPALTQESERIRRAAELSGADGFISGLPKGYDTVLGREFEGGLDLSLGQWQRIALARVLFRDASVLVLDEPTASLDPDAEETVFRTIRGYGADHIVLLISHRFTTVSMADYVYVMSAGAICEHGPHDDLLRRGGRYAQMYERQRTRRGRLIRPGS